MDDENEPLEPNQDPEPSADFEIIPEVWLPALLAITGDKERRADLIRQLSERTGLVPEKVELIISALLTELSNRSRSN